MPKPHDARKEALSDLERKLEAFEAKQGPKARYASGQAFNEGYSLVASLIGGLLGGIGLGWLFDRVADTGPWGTVGGLLIGSTVSIFTVVRAAGRMSDKAKKASPPHAAAALDDEDED